MNMQILRWQSFQKFEAVKSHLINAYNNQRCENSPERRKNGTFEHLSTKYVAGPNAGVNRLMQKNTAWATP